MLKKFLSIVCVCALSTAFVGCDAGAVADKSKDSVDSAASTTTDATGEMVPEGATEHVDGAGDTTKGAIDSATGN